MSQNIPDKRQPPVVKCKRGTTPKHDDADEGIQHDGKQKKPQSIFCLVELLFSDANQRVFLLYAVLFPHTSLHVPWPWPFLEEVIVQCPECRSPWPLMRCSQGDGVSVPSPSPQTPLPHGDRGITSGLMNRLANIRCSGVSEI